MALLIRKLIPLSLVLFLAVSSTACTQLFFFPQSELRRTPDAIGLDYDDVYLTTTDGVQLNGWLIKPATQPKGTIYFLHGNAENISTHIGSVLWMIEEGYQVFALDYRGYGKSEGIPNVPEAFEDIRAGAHWLMQTDPLRPVVLFGQSLGASMSITALQQHPDIEAQFDGFISEAAFSQYSSIGRETAATHWLTWAFQYPVSWLLQRSFDPIDSIADLQLPMLFVHSTEDKIIDIQHARRLYAKATEPKELLETQGRHIMAVAYDENRQKMLKFIEGLPER